MIYLFYLFVFLIGCCVGSFLNSVIFRLQTKESLVKNRSHCPYCKKNLSWFELIPIISFILQKGRCRKCKRKISWQYPLVELATGIFFVLVFNSQSIFNFQGLISVIFWFFVISCLIIIFVYDLKHYIIPNEVVYPAIIIAFFYKLFNVWNFGNWNLFKIWDLGLGVLPTLFFIAIVLFSRGHWMGMGDAKLVLFIGLVLGWPKILIALFLAFLSGALISIFLIILKKKTFKSQIPFGPFLSGAAIIVIFWGNVLVNWYFSFLGI